MEKLKSSLINMLLSLTIICVFAGGVLATVNQLTSEPIAIAKTAALEQAVRKVVPEFDNNPIAEAYKAKSSDGEELLIYPAKKNGQPVGVAVETSSKNGFSGLIRVIVGFDTEGKIINYSVLEHAETPGLGSKMQEWFRTEKNNQNVIGLSLAAGNLSLSKDGGKVDAITASTITSRAFLESINRAYSAYKGTDAGTGATIDTSTSASTDVETAATTDAVTATTTDAETGATESVESTDSTAIKEGGSK